MVPLSIGGVFHFSLFPRWDPEEDHFLANVYQITWIVFSYFALVQTLAFQIINSLSLSLLLSLPPLIAFFMSPIGYFLLPIVLATVPLMFLCIHLNGFSSLKIALTELKIAWRFENGEKRFLFSFFKDLLFGALLSFLIVLGVFPFSILIGIPLAAFILLILNGLGFSLFSSLFISIYLGWALVLFFLFSLRKKLDRSSVDQPKPVIPQISQRAKEILLSDDPPILCQSCGSFNAAYRNNCAVCNELLNQP